MLQTFLGALQDAAMKKRFGVVVLGLTLFVLMVNITVPGIDRTVWNALLSRGELFEFLGMFTGGALNNFSIVAMGITPYINASIIMQLLTNVMPKLHEMQKEGGEQGRNTIKQYTRYGTVGLSLLQSVVMVVGLMKATKVFVYSNFFYGLLVVFALTAGTLVLVWLGEKMTEKGIGNGTSMIILAGIVLRYPEYLRRTLEIGKATGSASYWFGLAMFFVVTLVLIVGIIALTQAVRRIPIQYAKRMVGRKMMGGQSTYLPIRVNNAGVISIIFAISILYLPSTFIQFLNLQTNSFCQFILKCMSHESIIHNLLYVGLVIFFTYFYSAITFNIADVSDNLKKQGGFIPGIRPGEATVEFLNKVMNRVTFISAILLALIAIAPNYIMMMTGIKSFYLGSTSLLIIVGVALDTMQQIEARAVMRNYKGFIK